MENADKCVQLLDQVMLTDGVFNHEAALQRLNEMKLAGEIDVIEYLNLVDAANRRDTDGNYERSLIYQRALADDQS